MRVRLHILEIHKTKPLVKIDLRVSGVIHREDREAEIRILKLESFQDPPEVGDVYRAWLNHPFIHLLNKPEHKAFLNHPFIHILNKVE